MTIATLKVKDLAHLGPQEQDEKFRAFTQGRHTLNGDLTELKKRIEHFEARYEMSSSVMQERVRNKTLALTSDIQMWATLVRLREDIVKKTSTPR